jgi:hypothetical protein
MKKEIDEPNKNKKKNGDDTNFDKGASHLFPSIKERRIKAPQESVYCS